MILPIAALLALVAADARTEHRTRARCVATLESMRPKHFATCGLAADFMAEVLRLLRRVFELDFDLASLRRHIWEFSQRLDKLFIKSHILDEAPGDLQHQTCAHLAIKSATQCPPIHVSGRVFHLWPHGASHSSEVQAALQGIQTVVDVTLDRLKSELPDDDFRMDMSAFDFYWWDQAKRNGDSDRFAWSDFETLTRKRIRRLFRACGVPSEQLAVGTQEFFQAGCLLYDTCLASRPGSAGLDNREVWAKSLSRDFQAKANATGTFCVLPQLVTLYLSIEASSCQVERDLGLVKCVAESQCGQNQSDSRLVEACVELIRDGPQSEKELFARPLQPSLPTDRFGSIAISSAFPSQLLLTDWSRTCIQLWREHHGCRFRLYKQRSDKGALRGHRKLSEASLISAQNRGRDAIVLGHGKDISLFGQSRDSLARKPQHKLEKSAVWNASFEQVHKLSASRAQHNKQVANLRSRRENPYPVGPLRVGGIFVNGGPDRPLASTVATRAIDLCSRPVQSHQGTTALRLDTGIKASSLLAQLQTAKTLVLDHIAVTDYCANLGCLAASAFLKWVVYVVCFFFCT